MQAALSAHLRHPVCQRTAHTPEATAIHAGVLPGQASLDEVDPQLLATFDKLGIPISEQKRLAGVKNVAYDYVFDSESIATHVQEGAGRAGHRLLLHQRGRPGAP